MMTWKRWVVVGPVDLAHERAGPRYLELKEQGHQLSDDHLTAMAWMTLALDDQIIRQWKGHFIDGVGLIGWVVPVDEHWHREFSAMPNVTILPSQYSDALTGEQAAHFASFGVKAGDTLLSALRKLHVSTGNHALNPDA
jgi:hypothetical protein